VSVACWITSTQCLIELSLYHLCHCRPANILLTAASTPVLVDFGFAQRYDRTKPDAFVSKLSYGTPEVRDTGRGGLADADQ